MTHRSLLLELLDVALAWLGRAGVCGSALVACVVGVLTAERTVWQRLR